MTVKLEPAEWSFITQDEFSSFSVIDGTVSIKTEHQKCCSRWLWPGNIQVQTSQWHKAVLPLTVSIPADGFCHVNSIFHSCSAPHYSFACTLANRHLLTSRYSAEMHSVCLPAENSLSPQPVKNPLVFSSNCSCCSPFSLVVSLSLLQEQCSCLSFQRLWISYFCQDWWQCCYSCLLYTLQDWVILWWLCALWLPGQVLFIQRRGL